MKALFVTHDGDDTEGAISAWGYCNTDPHKRVTFCITGSPKDAEILQSAKDFAPDVIFYASGCAGSGLPSTDTLRALRNYAKTIHLCGDSTDQPWHPALLDYKRKECFDLQVGIDGPIEAPVDMATISLMSPRHYNGTPTPTRDIICGWSGQYGPNTIREGLITALERNKLLTVRMRDAGPYSEYAAFLRRCEMVFNVSLTGSAERLQVKGRVSETALAGAALLEMEGSPVDRWFPRESVFFYTDLIDAARIIKEASQAEIADKAALFHQTIREKYNPRDVYGEMLARVGL
jgi:hypothetical protein